MTSSVLNIGVLFLPQFQLLDATGPIDYLNNSTKEQLSIARSPLAEKAPVINWHFISYTPDLTPIVATSGPQLTPTCTYADCPPLDYLLIPGPDPTNPIPEGCAEFLKARFEEVKLVLVICTAATAIAQTGILDGLRVCANKYGLKVLAEYGLLRKEVKWVGDRRWIKDGKVWSSAGVTAGIDLAAEFARVHFDPDIFEFTNMLFEYIPNPDQPDAFSKILEGVTL
ncbi:ThiJ/PfpI [Cyathus striatus]|nr:ThiJ/PfpI [Cyathus striatus]